MMAWRISCITMCRVLLGSRPSTPSTVALAGAVAGQSPAASLPKVIGIGFGKLVKQRDAARGGQQTGMILLENLDRSDGHLQRTYRIAGPAAVARPPVHR